MGQSCIPGPFALGERTSPALPRLLVLTICLNVTMHQSGRSLSGGSSVRLSLETGLSVTLLPADCQLHFCAPGLSVTICASGLSVTLLCFWTVSYTFVLLDCQLHFCQFLFFRRFSFSSIRDSNPCRFGRGSTDIVPRAYAVFWHVLYRPLCYSDGSQLLERFFRFTAEAGRHWCSEGHVMVM